MLRSIVEVFRGDYPVYYMGGIITPAQLLSVAIFVAGAILYYCLSRQPRFVAPEIRTTPETPRIQMPNQ